MDVEVIAVVVDPRAGEEAIEHGQALVEASGTGGRVSFVAEICEVRVGRLAQSHAQHGSPTAEMV